VPPSGPAACALPLAGRPPCPAVWAPPQAGCRRDGGMGLVGLAATRFPSWRSCTSVLRLLSLSPTPVARALLGSCQCF